MVAINHDDIGGPVDRLHGDVILNDFARTIRGLPTKRHGLCTSLPERSCTS